MFNIPFDIFFIVLIAVFFFVAEIPWVTISTTIVKTVVVCALEVAKDMFGSGEVTRLRRRTVLQ